MEIRANIKLVVCNWHPSTAQLCSEIMVKIKLLGLWIIKKATNSQFQGNSATLSNILIFAHQ